MFPLFNYMYMGAIRCHGNQSSYPMYNLITVFTIWGRGGHLGNLTSIMSSNFHFLVPVSFHIKVGSDLHSRF